MWRLSCLFKTMWVCVCQSFIVVASFNLYMYQINNSKQNHVKTVISETKIYNLRAKMCGNLYSENFPFLIFCLLRDNLSIFASQYDPHTKMSIINAVVKLKLWAT